MEQLKLFEGFTEIKEGDRVVIREEFKKGLMDDINFADVNEVNDVFEVTHINHTIISNHIIYETSRGLILYDNEVKRWNS